MEAGSLLASDWARRSPRFASPRVNGGRLLRGTGLSAAATPHRPGAGRSADRAVRAPSICGPGWQPGPTRLRSPRLQVGRSEPRHRRPSLYPQSARPGREATLQSASADATPLVPALSLAGTGPVGPRSLSLALRPGRSCPQTYLSAGGPRTPGPANSQLLGSRAPGEPAPSAATGAVRPRRALPPGDPAGTSPRLPVGRPGRSDGVASLRHATKNARHVQVDRLPVGGPRAVKPRLKTPATLHC